MRLFPLALFSFVLALLLGCGTKIGTDGSPPVGTVSKLIVTQVVPSSGDGGEVVSIQGDGFLPPVKVFFGKTEGVVLSSSETEVVVTVPSSKVAGAVDVTVIGRYGSTEESRVTYIGGFTYRSATDCAAKGPTITSFQPSIASNNSTITIRGTNFAATLGSSTIVSIGGDQASLTLIQSDLMIGKVPSKDNECKSVYCTFDVNVVNPDGCTATILGGFTYSRADDLDNDGLRDFEEELCLSDPSDRDTDDDNLTDFEECKQYGSRADNEDSDGDLLRDDWEITGGTSPMNPNSNCDSQNLDDFNDPEPTAWHKSVIFDTTNTSQWRVQGAYADNSYSLPLFDDSGWWVPFACSPGFIWGDSNCYDGVYYFRNGITLPESPARQAEIEKVVITGYNYWYKPIVETIDFNGVTLWSQIGGLIGTYSPPTYVLNPAQNGKVAIGFSAFKYHGSSSVYLSGTIHYKFNYASPTCPAVF